MSRILVSLVSKQTVPNVLFIKEMKEIDKYLFITTEKMEEDHKRETIINACKDSVKNNSSYIIAKEDSIIDLQDKLKDYTDAETADDDVFIVNLTGGTKLMSIGAFEIFRKKESQIFYIPLGKNKYRKISPDVKLREFELEYRFTLDGYLRANGIDIIHKVPDVRFDIEITKKFFSLFENDLMIHHLPLLRILKERIRNNPKWYRKHKTKPVSEFKGLDKLLYDLDLNITDIEKNVIDYIRGGWFEEYIYYFCDKIFDDDSLGLNYKLDLGGHVDNEFDVLFVHENCLYIIEAKTNLKGEKGSNIINNVIYKSAALNKGFGLSCKSYLFHLDKEFEQKQNYANYIKRAELMGLKVIGPDELTPSKIVSTIKSLLIK